MPLHIGESSRRRFAVAIYGIISMAVVVVAWEPEGDAADLGFLAAGYAVAIWLAHSFANVVSGGANASWRVALRHETSVMAGAPPVVFVSLLGALLFGFSATAIEVLALCSLVGLLAVVQLVLLRSAPPEQRRLGATLVLDLVTFLLIVLLLLAVH